MLRTTPGRTKLLFCKSHFTCNYAPHFRDKYAPVPIDVKRKLSRRKIRPLNDFSKTYSMSPKINPQNEMLECPNEMIRLVTLTVAREPSVHVTDAGGLGQTSVHATN